MIRLIVTDMDGTLLHDDKSMPDGTFALIDALHARGIHFAAASGRQYASLRDNFKEHATYMHFIAETEPSARMERRTRSCAHIRCP